MFTPEIIPGSIENIAQKKFTKMWANFARFGNPTPDNTLIQWKPVETDRFYYLEIGNEMTMKINPEPERMAFWEDVFRYNPMISKL